MENKKQPVVSIIIPTYNSGKTIEKCLQSIKKQSYPAIDIVVVDSPYYDKTQQKKCKKIIEKYARYFLDGPERSIQRNRGIQEAKGNFILAIDQDMYLTPDVVKECLQVLTTKKYIALTIPEISIGEGYWTECVALDRYITTFLEKGGNECCRFFRKKDALDIGGYNKNIVGAEDAEFHHKMELRGSIGKINAIIYHDEGKTNFWNRVKKKFYYSKAFREFLRIYPTAATKHYSPFKTAYIKHWRLLAQKPGLAFGILFLRAAEVSAGILGLIFSR